jgi:1,3-beta-glucan synthase
MTLTTPYLIYFWISVAALCIAPFVFNPHQFAFADFIIDYRQVPSRVQTYQILNNIN